jgi:cytochrome c oxidase subunit II
MTGWLQSIQSAAGMQGDQGAAIGGLFAIFLAVTAFFYLFVLLFLVWAVIRRRRDEASRERPLKLVLAIWVGVIAATLAGLTIATWVYDRDIAQAAEAPALEIEITANQWWWDVRYRDADPSRIVHTANELHLPVGVPVRITLRSNDVIHSFWIPNLAGKQDMVPGRQNQLRLTPLREGVYRAQCAEFCGLQHAYMALDVTVESPAAFAAWRQAQLAPAPAPTTPLARLGFALVTGRQCASCHNIAGTRASGQVAPDLTHFASRRSIAAGRLPMSRANIAAWIADPQRLKPGNNMPQVRMTERQLRAVTAYLETLR